MKQTERHRNGWIPVFPKAEEVLQVGIHRDLFGQILIGHAFVVDLDQHRTQRHSGMLSR